MGKISFKKINIITISLFLTNLIMLISLCIYINQLPEFIYSLDYIVKLGKFDKVEPISMYNLYDMLNIVKNSYFPLIFLFIFSPIILFCEFKHAITALICEILIIMAILFLIGAFTIIHYMGGIAVV